MVLLDRAEEIETVGDDGYRRIRADIIFGKLRPEQKLRLEALKEEYGVSVSTLREILSQDLRRVWFSRRVGAASKSARSPSTT